MRKSRFTDEQIIAMIREHESGVKTADICRKYGWCQTNANQSPIFARERTSGNKKFPPFAKRGVASDFKVCPRVKMPFEIEMVVYR
ncbi:transposase [Hyphomonas sp. WL0036]|nr:transposase [Hyphomonas sediminis]